jgi:hypothetical protein
LLFFNQSNRPFFITALFQLAARFDPHRMIVCQVLSARRRAREQKKNNAAGVLNFSNAND